ncbi:hypothetical protein CPB86DRAFT_823865 [Serendipita vermifera]|nr:hypothetical protein CPB86DRAFT_823865 [Serendipita vermifera]
MDVPSSADLSGNLELQGLRLNHQSMFEVADNVMISRYTSAVSVAILWYDTCLTLGDEVQYLWPKKWGSMKVLLYSNRLFSFVFLTENAYMLSAVDRSLTNKLCEELLIAAGIGAYVSFAMSNWILLARAIALCANSKVVRIGLITFYVLTYGVTAGFVGKTSQMLVGVDVARGFNNHSYNPPRQIFYSITIRSCGLVVRPHVMGYIWIGPMSFEMTIFIIILYQIYRRALAKHRQVSKLVSTLLRDGAVYYLVMIILRIVNLYSWLTAPPSRLFIAFLLLWSIMSIAVMRLQLNLLKASEPVFYTGSVSAFAAAENQSPQDAEASPGGRGGAFRKRAVKRHPFTLTFTFGNAENSFHTSSSVSTKPSTSIHAPPVLDPEQALPDAPPLADKTESVAHQHEPMGLHSIREVPREQDTNHDFEKGVVSPEINRTIKHQTQPSQESNRKDSGFSGLRLSRSLKRKKGSDEGAKVQENFALQDVSQRSRPPKIPALDTITYTFGMRDVGKQSRASPLPPEETNEEEQRR